MRESTLLDDYNLSYVDCGVMTELLFVIVDCCDA